MLMTPAWSPPWMWLQPSPGPSRTASTPTPNFHMRLLTILMLPPIVLVLLHHPKLMNWFLFPWLFPPSVLVQQHCQKTLQTPVVPPLHMVICPVLLLCHFHYHNPSRSLPAPWGEEFSYPSCHAVTTARSVYLGSFAWTHSSFSRSLRSGHPLKMHLISLHFHLGLFN